MTSTFTILCPYGIVLGADSAVTTRNPLTGKVDGIKTGFRKVGSISYNRFGFSCWGLGKINSQLLTEFLEDLYKETFSSDTIDKVANNISISLSNITPSISNRIGIHLAGYCSNNRGVPAPQLRHIFHESWHNPGQFVVENCHAESLTANGRVAFANYEPYPVLFNGDNTVANCLVNFIPIMTNKSQQIIPGALKLSECENLTELVVGIAIQRLNYYVDPNYALIDKTVGGKVTMARIIKNKGFEWIKGNSFLDRVRNKLS